MMLVLWGLVGCAHALVGPPQGGGPRAVWLREKTVSIETPPKRVEFRDGGGATKEKAVAVGESLASVERASSIGPRDVVVRCYDISSEGKLAPALSLATSKRVHWFPKLTCGVGDRSWAYDGEIERTSNDVVANAPGRARQGCFNVPSTSSV